MSKRKADQEAKEKVKASERDSKVPEKVSTTQKTGKANQEAKKNVNARESDFKAPEKVSTTQRTDKKPEGYISSDIGDSVIEDSDIGSTGTSEMSAGKDRRQKCILVIVILLILLLLILIGFTSLLFIYNFRMTEEVSRLKHNDKSCDSDWIEFEGSCYYFLTIQLTWQTSLLTCLVKGSSLASITSEQEQEFLNMKRNDTSCWIGLTDEDTEGVFRWADGTSLSYTYWMTDEPNNYDGNENCGLMQNSGQWNDVPCTWKLIAICEKKLGT
ncbi:C-type lectin domain family 4 member G-like isoform X2 [Mixophyes fleayi]|uniref:C-type lectin domain family 4 member G-like isoform X2 n=1 Tax=Mixophyes fleayi TaxID=3061075 RepID=UPI003F4E358B